jgi:Zn-dependent peptidase ImmA (M78 family)
VRARLRVSIEDQQSWRTASVAFDHWRDAAEQLGVSVLLFSMGKESVQGFSLTHRLAPVIAINATWREEARMFTLLHELGHLVTNTSSACSSERVPPGDPVERWCEEFAGQALVPRMALIAAVRRLAGVNGHVRKLEDATAIAKRFKVSLRAAVIALINANLATWALYREIPPTYDAKPKMGGGTGRSRREIREDQFGKRTAGLFVTAVNRDVISRSQALDYLDIPDSEFDQLTPMGASASAR